MSDNFELDGRRALVTGAPTVDVSNMGQGRKL
jgi:hypothetical protein